jgi:hypothetical protein
VELSELREELTVARNDVKVTHLRSVLNIRLLEFSQIQPSPEAAAHLHELESTAVDVEAKLKQAKAEAKVR